MCYSKKIRAVLLKFRDQFICKKIRGRGTPNLAYRGQFLGLCIGSVISCHTSVIYSKHNWIRMPLCRESKNIIWRRKNNNICLIKMSVTCTISAKKDPIDLKFHIDEISTTNSIHVFYNWPESFRDEGFRDESFSGV